MSHQHWEPDKVIAHANSMTLICPEEVQVHAKGGSKTLLQLIVVRNLSRRIISECCSEQWQPGVK
jgi:hypothetical protein